MDTPLIIQISTQDKCIELDESRTSIGCFKEGGESADALMEYFMNPFECVRLNIDYSSLECFIEGSQIEAIRCPIPLGDIIEYHIL